MNLIYPIKNGWSIFSLSNCECCEKAKLFLERIGEELNIINVDDVMKRKYTKKLFFEHMSEVTGEDINYFPLIFKEGEYIGGYENLLSFFEFENDISIIYKEE